MRSRVLPVILTVVIAFLLATSPVVSHAASIITGKQIKNGTITGADVKNRSLLAKDFKAGQLPAGPQGPQGAPGSPGSPGVAGAPGVSGREIVVTEGDFTTSFSQAATCPGTKKVLGGGHNWVGGQTDVWIWQSAPNSTGTAWVVRGNVNRGGSTSTISSYAICGQVD